MTIRYSETQVIAAVTRLSQTRLSRFVQEEIVSPVLTETGPVYRDVDRVRLELLCELSDDFDMDEDTLGVVISLIDQLHSTRAELRRVLIAIEAESDDVRKRIVRSLTTPGTVG